MKITPRQSPQANFTCYNCSRVSDKPFAKINRGDTQAVLCNAQCLYIALSTLGITSSDDQRFTSPVNITVRQSPAPYMSVNSERSPLSRSPGNPNLKAIPDASDSDSEDENPYPRDLLGAISGHINQDEEQVRRLGQKFLNKKSPSPE